MRVRSKSPKSLHDISLGTWSSICPYPTVPAQVPLRILCIPGGVSMVEEHLTESVRGGTSTSKGRRVAADLRAISMSQQAACVTS
jgi:hypothetical protein